MNRGTKTFVNSSNDTSALHIILLFLGEPTLLFHKLSTTWFAHMRKNFIRWLLGAFKNPLLRAPSRNGLPWYQYQSYIKTLIPAARAASILRATTIGLSSGSYPHRGTSGWLSPFFLETASYTFCHSPLPCGNMPSSFHRGSGWYAGQTIAATSYWLLFCSPASQGQHDAAKAVKTPAKINAFLIYIISNLTELFLG